MANTGGYISGDGHPPGTKGYVYCLKEEKKNEGDATFFKVGSSGDPKGRRKDLQTGNPRELTEEYSWEVDDMQAAENAVHTALREVGVYATDFNGSREWFEVTSSYVENFKKDLKKAVRVYKHAV